MRGYLIVIIIAAAALATPGATAQGCVAIGVGDACYVDSHSASGDCGQTGHDVGFTIVNVRSALVILTVHGYDRCASYPPHFTSQESGIWVHAFALGDHTTAGWTSYDQTTNGEHTSGCSMFAQTDLAGSDFGCPVGPPPSLPWGRLLP